MAELKKQFQFSIVIEADDIFEAQTEAKKFFGEEMYNREVFWEQIFKLPEPPIEKQNTNLSFEL
jgi:hypothetical protein